MGSRAVPGPPADEALVPWALTGAGPLPRRDHVGSELLPAVAARRGRTRGVRGSARAAGGRAGHRRDRVRDGRRERPGQAARAPAASVLELAASAHPDAAVDVVSIGSQRGGVRVRHRRLRRAAGARTGARSVGRRRCLLARLHRRSLPERRRGRRRDRDRFRHAIRTFVVAGTHDSRISGDSSYARPLAASTASKAPRSPSGGGLGAEQRPLLLVEAALGEHHVDGDGLPAAQQLVTNPGAGPLLASLGPFADPESEPRRIAGGAAGSAAPEPATARSDTPIVTGEEADPPPAARRLTALSLTIPAFRCVAGVFGAPPAGFEPATLGLEVRRSIQLSYGGLAAPVASARPLRRRPWQAHVPYSVAMIAGVRRPGRRLLRSRAGGP